MRIKWYFLLREFVIIYLFDRQQRSENDLETKHTTRPWITIAYLGIAEIMIKSGFEWFLIYVKDYLLILTKVQKRMVMLHNDCRITPGII